MRFIRSFDTRGIYATIWLLFIFTVNRIYSKIIQNLLSHCGERFSVAYPISILGAANIRIGSNFRSMKYTSLYADGGTIIIGNNLSLNSNVFIGASGGKIVIGDDVLIGPNVVLRAADHGLRRELSINQQPSNGGIITIEDDVWIGSNAVILRNVRLSKGSVIAAGAVVTKDTEPYSIVGGVPAKKISIRK
jgi:galactoside O-acetyltransferase